MSAALGTVLEEHSESDVSGLRSSLGAASLSASGIFPSVPIASAKDGPPSPPPVEDPANTLCKCYCFCCTCLLSVLCHRKH